MFSESIVKKFRAVFEKYNIKLSCVMSASDQIFAISHLYFLATFVWTPVCQTSAAKWLPRLIWKGILSTMFSESIVKKFEPFLKNITSNLFVSCQLLTRFRHITSLFLATFVWTPVCPTSAAKWLPRLIWNGILSTMFGESIVKKFRAVFEKYNIKLSCVMSASDQISPYHIFISRYVCMNASLSNQRG